MYLISLQSEMSCHLPRISLVFFSKFVIFDIKSFVILDKVNLGDSLISKFKNTMGMRFLSVQLEQLEEFGLAKPAALTILGLQESDLSNRNSRMNILDVENLYKTAASVLDDPDLGLRMGHSLRISTYGQTGSMFALCKNLKQVVEMNGKYQRIAIDAGTVLYEEKEENGNIKYFLNLYPYAEIKHCRHIFNMIARAYGTTFNWLSWSSGKKLNSASFMQPPPEGPSLFDEYYDCPTLFEQDKIGIEFHPDAINAKIATHDPDKLSVAIAKLDALLGSSDSQETFEKAVRASIKQALEMGQVSLPLIAQRMDLTERKLRHTLNTHNLKYRDLLDQERQSLFKILYNQGTSFSLISQELGYNDQPAFNRAFRRWHGMSPGEFVKKTEKK